MSCHADVNSFLLADARVEIKVSLLDISAIDYDIVYNTYRVKFTS